MNAARPGPLDMREAMYYALSLPVSTIMVRCDTVQQLNEKVRLPREYTPLNERQFRSRER